MASEIPLINAYSVVSKEEDDHVPALATACVDLDRPAARRVDPNVLPDVCGYSWEDDYFDDDDGIIAVFDFNYQAMEAYYSGVGWVCYGATLIVPWIFWTSTLLGVPCFLTSNVSWNVRSQHVAITRDGVKFVKERRQTCWGTPCTDAGKYTKTIPFDQITDCNILEPAGNTCLCIKNTLSMVSIDTASNNQQKPHELTIAGLNNAELFKKIVWAMKRKTTGAPSMNQILDRAGGSNSSEVATLLREIRDELRTHNDALQNLQQQKATPSSPTDSNIV